MILHFQIEVALTEDLVQLSCCLDRLRHIGFGDESWDLSAEATGEADESLVVATEKLHVNSRFYIESLGKTQGNQFYQVPVAYVVFAEQDQMGIVRVVREVSVVSGSGGKVDLAADDGLDAIFLAGVVKLYRSVHYSVVGNGDSGMPRRLCSRRDIFYTACTVKHTVFRMQM